MHKVARAPTTPLTPFPTLFTTPVYRQNSNTLELTVSNFYGRSIDNPETQPLEVWLGSVGPLKQRVYQSSAAGPLTSINSYQQQAGQHANPGNEPGSPKSPLESSEQA